MESPTQINQVQAEGTEPTQPKKGALKEEKKFAFIREARTMIATMLQKMDPLNECETPRLSTAIFSKTPLKAFSASETVTYEAFKNSGGIRSTVLAICKHCDDGGVVDYGSQALTTIILVDNASIQDMVAAGIVEGIVSAMKSLTESNQEDGKVSALKMVRSITQNESNRTHLWKAGAVDAVIEMMKQSKESARTLSHAALVLSNLAFGNKDIKDAVGNLGGITAITKGMSQHTEHQAMQARGSIALRNLCYNSEINQRVGGIDGAVEALVTAIQLQGDDREVVHQACVALTNLSNMSVDNRKRIVTAGGSMTLVKLMQRYTESTTVHDDCISIIRNIAAESKQAQEEIGESGGIASIVNALTHFNRVEKMCEKACAALRYLCFLPKNRERVGESKGIEEIVNALRTHVGSAGMVENALLAIGNATFENAPNKVTVGTCRGISTIVQAIEQHRMRVSIQEHGCRVVRNLVDGVEENVKIAADGDTITAGVFAMMGYADNGAVQEQVCAMFLNMCEFPGVLEKLRKADAKRLAEKALDNHPKHRGVQLQAGTLVDRMNGYDVDKTTSGRDSGPSPTDLETRRNGNTRKFWPFAKR